MAPGTTLIVSGPSAPTRRDCRLLASVLFGD